jgi:hypothetical protein
MFFNFNCFIALWSLQSLIGESSRSSAAVSLHCLFYLKVLYSLLTIFEFLIAYVPFFCAHEKVHANVLAIPLSLVVT